MQGNPQTSWRGLGQRGLTWGPGALEELDLLVVKEAPVPQWPIQPGMAEDLLQRDLGLMMRLMTELSYSAAFENHNKAMVSFRTAQRGHALMWFCDRNSLGCVIKVLLPVGIRRGSACGIKHR